MKRTQIWRVTGSPASGAAGLLGPAAAEDVEATFDVSPLDGNRGCLSDRRMVLAIKSAPMVAR
jgi:hypothetical protein